MPWAPPTHSQLQGRKAKDQQYNRKRSEVRGPDPRSTARWRALREQVLTEEPWCANPYGLHRMRREATQVDHVMPLALRPDLALERSNLQGLCTTCHGRKTAQERYDGKVAQRMVQGCDG